MSEKSEREHESTQETEGKIDLFEFFSDFPAWLSEDLVADPGPGLPGRRSDLWAGSQAVPSPCTRARRPLR